MSAISQDFQLKTQQPYFTVQTQAGSFPSSIVHKIWEAVKLVFSSLLAIPLYPLKCTGLLSEERYTKITGFNAQKTTDLEAPLINNTGHTTTLENDSLENKALCQSETGLQASLSENIEKQSKLCESLGSTVKDISRTTSCSLAAFFANALINSYYAAGWIGAPTRLILTGSAVALLGTYLFVPTIKKMLKPNLAAPSSSPEKLEKKSLTEDLAQQAKIYEIMLKTKNDIEEAYLSCTNIIAGCAPILVLVAAATHGKITHTTGLVLSTLINLAWVSNELVVRKKIPFF